MTRQEFSATTIRLFRAMIKNHYSEGLIEIVSNMFLPVPRDRLEETLVRFTELAEQNLPQEEFHYEISQVIKEIMGYENSPSEMM